MGNVFLHGKGGAGGSGGSALMVVGGTTRPAKPTQNMIWANTPNDITSVVFSASEPSNPAEGMLWITLADSSRIKIASPVGDDWLTVYPLNAKQYVSGALVGVEAKSYQNGEWVDWVTYLYKSGDLCTGITGGWITSGYSAGSFSLTAPTFAEDRMILDRGSARHRGVGTNNLIDTTGFTKLKFYGAVTEVGTWEGKQYGIAIKLCPTKNYADEVCAAKMHLLKGEYNGENAVLSVPEGKYYIVVHTESVEGITGYMTKLGLE